jgi:hypothetical protein
MPPLTEEQMELLCTPTQCYEWLGVQYQHGTTPTRCLGPKSLAKIDAAAAVLTAPTTRRQLAAVFGLLFYAADVIGHTRSHTTLAHHFGLLRFFRRNVSCIDETASWEDIVHLPISLRTEAARWLQELRKNEPVDVLLGVREAAADEPSGYDVVLVSDASESGWGAIAWNPLSGDLRAEAFEWSALDRLHDVGSSVVAEPLAIKKALLRFVAPTNGLRVLILTDHSGLVAAVRSGFGKAETYNELALVVEHFATIGCTVDAAWTPGATNPADHLSRGLAAESPITTATLADLVEAVGRRAEDTRGRTPQRDRERGEVWMV